MIGLGVSLDLFFSIRKKRFIAIVAGWGIWVIASFLPIIHDYFIQNRLLLVLNATLSGEGLLLIFLGIFSYFYLLKGKLVFSISIIYLIIPITLDFCLGEEIALFVSVLLHLLTYVIIFFGVIRTNEEMQQVFSKGVKFFYLTVGTVLLTIVTIIALNITVEDYSFGLYNSVNNRAVIINYSLAIFLTVIILILFIYIERGIIADDKFQLKDKYSHNLGNLLQILLSAISLTELDQLSTNEKTENMALIQSKIKEASDLLNEIRQL
jgi:hypothetical protein